MISVNDLSCLGWVEKSETQQPRYSGPPFSSNFISEICDIALFSRHIKLLGFVPQPNLHYYNTAQKEEDAPL